MNKADCEWTDSKKASGADRRDRRDHIRLGTWAFTCELGQPVRRAAGAGAVPTIGKAATGGPNLQ